MAAVIQSLGALADLQPNWLPSSSSFGVSSSLTLYDSLVQDYAAIYRTQPAVRTVVSFIARNIAQLGLHVYRRVSDTDRQRLADHGLARLISQPNPDMTTYRLIDQLLHDMGIYGNSFLLKLRGPKLALARIPPQYMGVRGGLVPTAYQIWLGGSFLEVLPSEVVHFRIHNPDNPIIGLSPLETLRRILAEEAAAGDWREGYWKNAARQSGIVERPADAPAWSEEARLRWVAEFEALYSGSAGSGRTIALEEGMTFKTTAFNPEQSQYLGSRKLSREEVAAAYHVPPPMVGILDHANFSNITQQHKMLYQDCLGPSLVMIEQEIDLQLLPEFADSQRIYCEFNLAEKLKGSFEEQAAAMSTMVGRPVMTANEGRARLNLPSINGDADQLVTPLNVLVGGQASPRDSAPPKLFRAEYKAAAGEIDPTNLPLREKHQEKWRQVLVKFFERQQAAVEARVGGKAAVKAMTDDVFDIERWNRELGADLYALNVATASTWAKAVGEALGIEVDLDRLLAWLEANARISAEAINALTQEEVATALGADVPIQAVRDLFSSAIETRVPRIAETAVTRAANFGSVEAATQSGHATKTWHVNSSRPRPSHAALSGTTIAMDARFANGCKFPGDPAGGADEVAGCMCSCTFQKGDSQP